MDEYIKRKAALEECDWYANEFCECEYAIMPLKGALEILPAADVRPVRFGKLEKYGAAIRCSVCGFDTQSWDVNFCPNCGAWMEES